MSKESKEATGKADFKASLVDVSLFRDSLQAIAELISEGIFYAKEDGIHFTATDPTMVTLIDFKFDAKAFDSYKIEGTAELAVNLGNVISVLRRVKAGETVKFDLDKDHKLIITVKGSSVRRFTIPILDIEKAEVPDSIKQLDYPATLEMLSEILADGIEDASVVTDTVVLSASPEIFQMVSEGDLSKVELSLEKGASGLNKLIAKREVKSKFSLDYLKKISRGAKIGKVVKIELGSDFPIRVTFKAPNNKAELTYILAPRVED